MRKGEGGKAGLVWFGLDWIGMDGGEKEEKSMKGNRAAADRRSGGPIGTNSLHLVAS